MKYLLLVTFSNWPTFWFITLLNDSNSLFLSLRALVNSGNEPSYFFSRLTFSILLSFVPSPPGFHLIFFDMTSTRLRCILPFSVVRVIVIFSKQDWLTFFISLYSRSLCKFCSSTSAASKAALCSTTWTWTETASLSFCVVSSWTWSSFASRNKEQIAALQLGNLNNMNSFFCLKILSYFDNSIACSTCSSTQDWTFSSSISSSRFLAPMSVRISSPSLIPKLSQYASRDAGEIRLKSFLLK